MNTAKKNKYLLSFFFQAEKNELKKSRYNSEGEKIILFCDNKNIKLIQDIKFLKNEYFSDGIHLNKDGQKMIADILSPEIIEAL